MAFLLDSTDVPRSVMYSSNQSSSTTASDTSTNILKNKEGNATSPDAGAAAAAAATTAQTTLLVSDFLNMPWLRILAVVIFLLLIFITIIGNTLVILSVLTTRRLRTVTNCFVMNLAVADWLVGMFVMPPAVVLYIVESWKFGWILCDIWISLDVLLCTASILSLCAISLDRYLAVTQPLTYSKRRRSKRLALFIIIVVWLAALTITCPPFFGWYEVGREKEDSTVCRYNENKGYVVFSAMGSFFIPLAVMLYVYLKIGCVLSSRRHRITQTEATEKSANIDLENYASDAEQMQHNLNRSKFYGNFEKHDFETQLSDKTLFELIEISKSSSTVRCSTITCKYDASGNGRCGGGALGVGSVPSGLGIGGVLSNGTASNHVGVGGLKPIQSIQFCETSVSETSLTTSKIKVNQGKCYRVPMRISTLKRESKTAKTLTMVMGGFIVCWLPFFIYYLLTPFLPKESVDETLQSFLTWLGWINSAINPFIYAFYNADFRTAFWRLTIRRISRRQSSSMMFRN